MNYLLNLQSSNSKLGVMPATSSNSSTCPSACPLKEKGCYAKYGPISWQWQKIDNGSKGTNWESFIQGLSKIRLNTLWRHNVMGDLAGLDNQIDVAMLGELVKANNGKKGFAYTHKPVTGNGTIETSNREAIKQANKDGFTINLSGNSLTHADELKALAIAPVVAIIPSDFQGTKGLTPKGNRFIVCPAQSSDITCKDCGLCQKQRGIIVAFKAHGTCKKTVDKIVNK